MTNIELFALICDKLQRSFATALKIGAQKSFLLIASPLQPFDLQTIYAEFDGIPNTSPRISKFIEQTENMINQWNQSIIQLKIDPAPLCLSIGEDYSVFCISDNYVKEWRCKNIPYSFTYADVIDKLKEIHDFLTKLNK